MAPLLVVEALGTRVGIDVDSLSDEAAVLVRESWRDASSEGLEPAVVVEPGPGADTAWLLSSLSQSVTLAAIEARKGDLWLLHAAGVALPDGRVVVLVGPSGRGKTTLARHSGTVFGYVSDETIGIDDAGRVWPYRKPLSIIQDASSPKAQRAPSELGLGALPDAPLRAAAIVLLDRREDAGDEPIVEPVDLGDALVELVEQSSYLTCMPSPLQTIARLVARAGGVQRLTYRDADSVTALIPRLAGDVDSVADVQVPTVDPCVTGGVEPSYFRAATLDSIALGDPDRVAVLQLDGQGQGVVRVLAGIAPSLWRAASGASPDALVAAAIADCGKPEDGDAAALVGAAADELVEAGVLELRPGRWAIRTDVAWTDVAGRIAALPLAEPWSQPVVLGGSAEIIWRALGDGPADVGAVVARVAELAGVQAEAVADDVAGFLRELEREALVTRW